MQAKTIDECVLVRGWGGLGGGLGVKGVRWGVGWLVVGFGGGGGWLWEVGGGGGGGLVFFVPE